ncbi:MAG: NAD(P)H-dependent glycerol-3-phosphate dehydrogenase [Bacteroidales bacterium]
MEKTHRVAVIGSGSWATALMKIFLNNLDEIKWYLRDTDTIDYIKKYHHNPKYVSSIGLNTDKIRFYNNLPEIIENSDVIVFAVPSPFLKDSLDKHRLVFENKFIVSAIKGIIPQLNLTVAEFFNQVYGVPFKNIGIISGPCHAEEIALERLSYLTVASATKSEAEELAILLRCNYVKVKSSKDIYGIEYAAVLKNIMAIAAGICHGLGYGDNFLAVLISNASQEIKRFLDNTYKSKRKVNSSAYLGDLLVTSYSQFSRNRTFGTMIGKGYSVKSAQLEMNMIAEGYHAIACIKEINKVYNVRMPILDAVYHIVNDRISPALEIKLLSENLK